MVGGVVDGDESKRIPPSSGTVLGIDNGSHILALRLRIGIHLGKSGLVIYLCVGGGTDD